MSSAFESLLLPKPFESLTVETQANLRFGNSGLGTCNQAIKSMGIYKRMFSSLGQDRPSCSKAVRELGMSRVNQISSVSKADSSSKIYSKSVLDVLNVDILPLGLKGSGLMMRRFRFFALRKNSNSCDHSLTPMPRESSRLSSGRLASASRD